jgi:hypothetical protein
MEQAPNNIESTTLQEQAQFVKETIARWKQTGQAVPTLSTLYDQYFRTDGIASETATIMLNQAAMNFSLEANLSSETDWQIMGQAREKARQ